MPERYSNQWLFFGRCLQSRRVFRPMTFSFGRCLQWRRIFEPITFLFWSLPSVKEIFQANNVFLVSVVAFSGREFSSQWRFLGSLQQLAGQVTLQLWVGKRRRVRVRWASQKKTEPRRGWWGNTYLKSSFSIGFHRFQPIFGCLWPFSVDFFETAKFCFSKIEICY